MDTKVHKTLEALFVFEGVREMLQRSLLGLEDWQMLLGKDDDLAGPAGYLAEKYKVKVNRNKL